MEQVKRDIVAYWTDRAAGFADLRIREFHSDLHLRWLDEIEPVLAAAFGDRRPLRVLDIGTGTGFFALLLASRGHEAVGIDITQAMIDEARSIASDMGASARFLTMDAEAPMLEPASFDAIVTRNLTWGLPHLERAYRAWHGLLAPGGVLINFDADYCRENDARGGAPLPSCGAHKGLSAKTMGNYERIKGELRPLQKPRPLWDAELLRAAGFSQIEVDDRVYQRIYRQEDEFYNPTPIFKITACA